MNETGIMLATVDWVSASIGILGVVAGFLGTLIAVKLTHQHDLKLERVQNQQRIDGILQAIRCELTVMQKAFDDDIGAMLKMTKVTEPFDRHFSMMTEKYFIVYPNNTEIVGQINDPELVRSVVTSYTTANLLIEGYRMNNWYRERHKELEKEQHNAEGDVFAIECSQLGNNFGVRRRERLLQQIIPALVNELKDLNVTRINHTKLLKNLDDDLHKEVAGLLAKIEDYRKRNPKSEQFVSQADGTRPSPDERQRN